MRNALTLVVLSALAFSCREAPKRRCFEYDKAEATFNELTGQILDPTFGDPRFAVAAEAFEAVPEDCRRQQQGLTIARTIRSGIAQRAAEPAPAPVVFAPPRPTKPPPRARQEFSNIELPTPQEEGPSKKDCADFVLLFRNSCPGNCMQEDSNRSAYACWETCEGALAILLSDAGCPAVPRTAAPPQAPQGQAAAPAAPPAAKAPEPPKPTGRSYCAYFLPDGNNHYSYCLSVPLPEAEAHCAAELKSKNIEGTCSCSDDPRFIGDRCK